MARQRQAAQHEAAAFLAARPPDLGQPLADLGQRQLGAQNKGLRRRSELDPDGCGFEKRGAGSLFQSARGAVHRGLRQPEPPGRDGKAARARHRDQRAQLRRRHHPVERCAAPGAAALRRSGAALQMAERRLSARHEERAALRGHEDAGAAHQQGRVEIALEPFDRLCGGGL